MCSQNGGINRIELSRIGLIHPFRRYDSPSTITILPCYPGDTFEKKPFFSPRKSEGVDLKGRKFLGSLFSQEEPAVSLIGEESSVVGTLNFGEGVVRLYGRLEGKIIGRGTLIIGEKGILQGGSNIGKMVLGGRVEGPVTAPDSVHISSTGKLFGKVRTSQLVIDEGGIFEGESVHLDRLPTPGSSNS